MNIKKICFILFLSLYYFNIYPKDNKIDFPITETNQIFNPIYGKKGMVVSQEEIASRVGAQILKQGGNAVDAAVAVGYALAVTLPKAGNIGGGGFMLIWLNKQKKSIVINYRETAPKKAYKNMFVNEDGFVNEDSVDKSYKSVGVPGTVYGLNLALKKYGTMSLDKVMQPAINLAKNGFEISHSLYKSFIKEKKLLSTSEETIKIFFDKNKEPKFIGNLLVQKDLAKTLELISRHGTKEFYEGIIADKIVKDMEENGGLITKEDLKNYKAEEMEPIFGTYRGYHIISVPPPSSGGVTLIEMLNILENFNIKEIPLNSAKFYHIMTEIMNYAYYDRNTQLGDPNFVNNPIEQLISKSYAKKIFKKINKSYHTPSNIIQKNGEKKEENQNGNTTHFSVIDKDGNIVSNTYTLNFLYGNGKVVKGTGILLNNEMGDFTIKVGTANTFGLIQGEANSIEPLKRPLSSMTPTIVLNEKKEPLLATGAPGGSRITTQIFNFLVGYIDYNLNIATSLSRARTHSQLWPDEMYFEEGLSEDTIDKLKCMGHSLTQSKPFGSIQAAEQKKQNEIYFGASDPRSEGDAAIGVIK